MENVKKFYEAPEVTKVEFDYSDRVAATTGFGGVTKEGAFGGCVS